jgi:biopolymer transport protein ExbB
MDFQESISHFLNQSDSIGQMLFFMLITMSLVSWYLIFVKAVMAFLTRYRTKTFLAYFWESASLNEVAKTLSEHSAKEPFTHLTYHAVNALRHHAKHGSKRLEEAGNANEFLSRAIRRVIDEETARVEWGLTALASIASTAPFVGLFGTVWGVYHALIGIGKNGQGTLEQIASPVGEALIMTGLGLAVAIPAVLAYNNFVRSNRVLLAQLDAFAHDLFSLLTTGSAISSYISENLEYDYAMDLAMEKN